jgi:GNAT superfamily N-acetyltransferase
LIQVRRASLEDAGSISSVLYESFLEYEAAYTPEAFQATTPSAGQIERRMEAGPAWVAVWDGQVVGTVSAVAKGTALYIRSMAILPSARGQGLGSRLMVYVEEYASENGLERMWLSTTPFLARAIRLYESCGFQRSEVGPHDLHGTPLFTMVKTI